MPSVRSALLFSISGKYLIKVISLISTIVVARLLSPSEIGTFAIASALVMLIAEFRMFGANTYLVREETIDTAKVRSSYGLTILISWGLGFTIFILSPYLAGFFSIGDLKIIFWLLSISFLFAPYISIPNALLTRDYKFKQIMIIKLVGSIVQIISVIAFIMMGLSYFSLALSQTASTIIKSLLSLYYTRDTNIYIPSFKNLKPIASLGIYTTIGNSLRKTQTSLPDIIIGRLGSTVQVGIFSRGLGFIDFVSDAILSGISPVALPYLAKSKSTPSEFSRSYCLATSLITFLLWPILIVCSVASYPAIVFMFGAQWEAAAPLASIIAIWGITRSGHTLAYNAFIISKNERLMVLKEFMIFCLFTGAIIIGFNRGLIGVSYSFVIIGFIDLIFSIILLHIYAGIPIISQARALFPSAIVSLVCYLFVYLLDWHLDFASEKPIVSLLYISLTLPILWYFLGLAFKHPIIDEINSALRRGASMNKL